ncbi:carbonic anhydrase [Brachymonas sp. G13]|uniref:carbonic anhydrase n=1 Tax=Brachymonas wangyanguii TaxID=3130163 RepID=UPI0016A4D40E|nr:carbonic anhydrase [Ramlibacter sp.]
MPQSVDHLVEGFKRFQHNYFGSSSVFDTLREGQRPSTLIIGCCDSRVHPPMLTDTAPGEVFTVRNVANLVPPCEPDNPHASVAAALEFAVLALEVEHVIVMGHSACGGIRALMNRTAIADSALGKWLAVAEPARQHVCLHHADASAQEQQKLAEQAAILVSLNNLLSYPWVADRVAEGSLVLHGWYFDLREGALWGYDAEQHAFTALVCPLTATALVAA